MVSFVEQRHAASDSLLQRGDDVLHVGHGGGGGAVRRAPQLGAADGTLFLRAAAPARHAAREGALRR